MKLSGSLFRAQCRAACRAARRVKLSAAAAPARDVLYAPQMSALWQIIIKEFYKSINILLFRFVCELPRVDALQKRTRNPSGNCWKSLVWQVCPSAQIPDWELHAGADWLTLPPDEGDNISICRRSHRRAAGSRRRSLWTVRATCCSYETRGGRQRSR